VKAISIHKKSQFLWVNKRRASPGYRAVEEHEYVFDERVGGWKQINPGSRFVYYRPREGVLFATGTFASVSRVETGLGARLTASISDYELFQPAVPVTKVKPFISFLARATGLRGVPQNSITPMSEEEFATILRAREALRTQPT
jgi:hypothetical protein